MNSTNSILTFFFLSVYFIDLVKALILGDLTGISPEEFSGDSLSRTRSIVYPLPINATTILVDGDGDVIKKIVTIDTIDAENMKIKMINMQGEPLTGQLSGMLDRTNSFRINVNPPAYPALPLLTWSDDLAVIAQSWASSCIYKHDTISYLGQNLYAFYTSNTAFVPTAARAVNLWGGENKYYQYAANTCIDPVSGAQKVCGHYTQLVSANSERMGCGYKKCTTGSPLGGKSPWHYYVCSYDPPGNYKGEWPYQVA